MRIAKQKLLSTLEEMSLELIQVQYRLEAEKRKPIPTIPVLYVDEYLKDPFEVSTDLCI